MVELPVDIKLRLDFKQFPPKMQKKFPRISNKQNTSELCVENRNRMPSPLPIFLILAKNCSRIEVKTFPYFAISHEN